MADTPIVILDSNVWISERLLLSAMGDAFLHAMSGMRGGVVLPEVVELEVAKVLEDAAENAVQEIEHSIKLLKQLSGHKSLNLIAPSPEAIRAGIAERWINLSGLIRRVPFTQAQATAALIRINAKLPPCGSNNEQFRDCCVWETALELLSEGEVHLVTADSAFYEGRDRSRQLATSLSKEVAQRDGKLKLHKSIAEFLAFAGDFVTSIDLGKLETSIAEALLPNAMKTAEQRFGGMFKLGPPTKPKIKGYAMPRTSALAVSFSLTYPVFVPESSLTEELGVPFTLQFDGTCTYDPKDNVALDISIDGWTKTNRDGGLAMWSESSHGDRFKNQYQPGRMRWIGF